MTTSDLMRSDGRRSQRDQYGVMFRGPLGENTRFEAFEIADKAPNETQRQNPASDMCKVPGADFAESGEPPVALKSYSRQAQLATGAMSRISSAVAAGSTLGHEIYAHSQFLGLEIR